jgi:probable addiction module antidote protein
VKVPVETRPFDPAAYLDSEEAIAAYMAEALDSNDAALIADALCVIARAREMNRVTTVSPDRQRLAGIP